jgi:hypothetical protein
VSKYPRYSPLLQLTRGYLAISKKRRLKSRVFTTILATTTEAVIRRLVTVVAVLVLFLFVLVLRVVALACIGTLCPISVVSTLFG